MANLKREIRQGIVCKMRQVEYYQLVWSCASCKKMGSNTVCFSQFRVVKGIVGNEKEGGSGRWQMIGIGLGPRRILLAFNFAVVFIFMYFRFRKETKINRRLSHE